MTITELLDLAKQIKNETVEEANSATRVGNAILQIIEFFFQYLTGNSLTISLDNLYAPKDVFETESDLNSNLPDGAEGVYLVLETGHWYFYNTLLQQWQDGGVYQAPLAMQIINTTVNTYADMLALTPVTKNTNVLVLTDYVNNNGNTSEYMLYTNGTIMWRASINTNQL